MTSCILLAAGESSRFGSPKAITKLHNSTIIEYIQATLIDSNIDEIIIVLGAHQHTIKPFISNHKKVKTTYNKDYKFGQTSSFKTGVSEISSTTKNILLLPVDYPLIKTETFNQIISFTANYNSQITIPTYENRRGHPPVFNIALKNDILNLSNSVGINTLFQKNNIQISLCPVSDSGILKTFNTQEEFLKLTST